MCERENSSHEQFKSQGFSEKQKKLFIEQSKQANHNGIFLPLASDYLLFNFFNYPPIVFFVSKFY